jgi:hypothetical protein
MKIHPSNPFQGSLRGHEAMAAARRPESGMFRSPTVEDMSQPSLGDLRHLGVLGVPGPPLWLRGDDSEGQPGGRR